MLLLGMLILITIAGAIQAIVFDYCDYCGYRNRGDNDWGVVLGWTISIMGFIITILYVGITWLHWC